MRCRLFNCVMLALIVIICSACSNSEDQQQQNIIEQKSDELAHGTAEKLKSPIVKAEAAKLLSEEHNRKINEAISDQ